MKTRQRVALLFCLLISLTIIRSPYRMQAQTSTITINVDASANRRPINPMIYGVAFASSQQLTDLNVPVHRSGGNNTSRYNWQQNADNRGFDWYFQSIAYSSSTAGEVGDSFISSSKAAGAQPMLTIPMVGWVAKLGANRSKLCSYSIAKYGQQTGNDWQWFPDAGNGILTNGQEITWNDPNDANTPANSTFQQGWVQHLVSRWGNAANGGLRYYILDNEHSIWHSTHRDVHPTGATMDEVKSKMIDYGGKIKAIDPTAKVVGPEEWGWSGYLLSGYDQQYGAQHGWSNLPDRANHGGMDYLPWLLDQLRQHQTSTGQRLLDVFTVHYYPQGGEFSDDVSSGMQLRRNRSTRSLWDPTYTDETWINDKVQLVPRLRNWVNTYYPGTEIGITEYNWGAEGHINGATTQADIFGIFGREGLDIGARWTTPATGTPTYNAIKMYRNYDGNKSTFGDTSVSTTAPNPDNVSAFSALRTSDGALTVMLMNKQLSTDTPINLNLANFTHQGRAKVWRLTSSNTISALSDITFSGNTLTTTLPRQSITLLVLPAGTAVNQSPVASATANPTTGAAPLAVSFNGSASTDPDGSIVSYAWNFGDTTSGSGVTTSHTYTTAGTYTATLTVTDNGGKTASTSLTITATGTDPNLINAPSNLTATVASRKVTLRWTDRSTNETGFYVERALKSNGTFSRIATLKSNVTTYSQTVSRNTYLYRVQAFNQSTGRVSAYSNQVEVLVK
ncbi:MAG TPA: glycoside hydrolase family 44 protein [Acidobacteriota bacterium]|nr:glycoside hydrolase family 44 protein [Acidobacteriota bacterium]